MRPPASPRTTDTAGGPSPRMETPGVGFRQMRGLALLQLFLGEDGRSGRRRPLDVGRLGRGDGDGVAVPGFLGRHLGVARERRQHHLQGQGGGTGEHGVSAGRRR